jgi:creatinine amidohydrolase
VEDKMIRKRICLFIISFILVPILVFSQTMKKGVLLETLTWKEAEKLFKEYKVMVIALGARCKEHGLHLPLNNDFIMAEYLKERVCSELKVIVAPTLQYGYYPAFLEYPGSASLSLDTFTNVLIDICRSFNGQGIKHFYIVNTGISTLKGLSKAAEELKKEGIILRYTNLLEDGEKAVAQVEKQEGGSHADEIETSMMLYIAPEVVNMKKAKKDYHPRKGPGPFSRDAEERGGIYSPTGAWGDPTLASREKGEIVVEALVKDILSDIRELIKLSRKEQ